MDFPQFKVGGKVSVDPVQQVLLLVIEQKSLNSVPGDCKGKVKRIACLSSELVQVLHAVHIL